MTGTKIDLAAAEAFPAWVSETAIQSLEGLSGAITQDEGDFLRPLFEDENLKSFWSDFSGAGHPFFSQFFYRLIRSRRFFIKKQKIADRRHAVKEGLSTIQNCIEKIEKAVVGIKEQDLIEGATFDDFLLDIQYYRSQALPLWAHQIKITTEGGLKNRQRPLTRESFGKNSALPSYYGRVLYNFFQQNYIKSEWKKPDARLKSHICEIVNALIDSPDDPLTVSALTNSVSNFRKLS